MFIKRTTKKSNGNTYVNHLLVESVITPKGPRHRVVCSLGSLAPAPRSEWLALARKAQSALSGQPELLSDKRVQSVLDKTAQRRARGSESSPADRDLLVIHTEGVQVLDPREAGAVHVAHQMWKRLGLDSILLRSGLSAKSPDAPYR